MQNFLLENKGLFKNAIYFLKVKPKRVDYKNVFETKRWQTPGKCWKKIVFVALKLFFSLFIVGVYFCGSVFLWKCIFVGVFFVEVYFLYGWTSTVGVYYLHLQTHSISDDNTSLNTNTEVFASKSKSKSKSQSQCKSNFRIWGNVLLLHSWLQQTVTTK